MGTTRFSLEWGTSSQLICWLTLLPWPSPWTSAVVAGSILPALLPALPGRASWSTVPAESTSLMALTGVRSSGVLSEVTQDLTLSWETVGTMRPSLTGKSIHEAF